MSYPGFVTRVTGPVQLAEREAYPSGVPELTRFIGVRVTKSLVFCVVFCPFVFSLLLLYISSRPSLLKIIGRAPYFGHCVVSHLIYGF